MAGTEFMEEVIDYKYRDIGKDQLMDHRHSHGNCYEIVQVIAGEGTFIIDNEIYPLEGGAVYLINGIDIHCSNPKKPEAYIRNKVVISAGFIHKVADALDCREVLEGLFGGGKSILLTEEWFQYIDRRMKQIGDALASDLYGRRIGVSLGVLDICNALYHHSQAAVLPVEGILGEAMKYINDHITEKILLDEICAHINMNKYHLCHLFKQTTSMTISEYILEKRLSIAKRKLLMTEYSLSEIALDTGFGSFSYFSTVFKRNVGISPREFRRQYACKFDA